MFLRVIIPYSSLATLVNQNSEGNSTVDARILHGYLGVGKQFQNWIKDRINKYLFVENEDFIINTKTGKNKSSGETRGRKAYEYTISLDMAKELAMVENNELGRKARRYFIEVEKINKLKVSLLACCNFTTKYLIEILFQYLTKRDLLCLMLS